MTRYLEPSFSTLPPAGQTYRDNHDRIFGKKDAEPEAVAGTGSYDPSSREVEFAAFDQRVAEVEAKASAGTYDDARVADAYTPEELVLHAFYLWRSDFKAYLDELIAQDEEEHTVETLGTLREVRRQFQTCIWKRVPVRVDDRRGCSVTWGTAKASK